MFTGIVEEVGIVRAIEALQEGLTLRIGATRVLEDLALGDSIAHDGVCLTVTRLLPDGYEVQAVATTLERTTLGGFRAGRRVNLERALAFGARLGGHWVQGHVDGIGRIERITSEGELTRIEISVPEEVAAITVPRGSIAVDGISLTVNAIPAPGRVELSIIPFTLAHTNLGDAVEADAVNLEGDMMGKYVRHLLGAPEASHLRAAWGYGAPTAQQTEP